MPNKRPQEMLDGWKQIASYIDVSQPTARKYHKKSHLPVYRRGRRYYAFPEELSTWLRQQRTTPRNEERNVLETPFWRRIVAVVTIVIVFTSVGILSRTLSLPGPPEGVSVDGTVLIALDQEERIAWKRDLSEALNNTADIQPGSILIEDFDHDGRKEIAVTVRPVNIRAETSKLLAFDDDGETLWEFLNGRELTVGDRYFEPYYAAKNPRWLETKAGSFILNVADHSIWYPTQVSLLDPQTGSPLLEYWHPGRISAQELCDLDGDGEEELYLGGINNPGFGPGHPSLAVLPLPRPGNPVRLRDTFLRNRNPAASSYLLFHLYDVFEVREMGASVRRVDCQESGRLSLGIGTDLPALAFLYLNAELQVEDIRPSDGLIQLHKRLYLEGVLDHPYQPSELSMWSQVASFSSLPNGNGAEVQTSFQSRHPTRRSRKDIAGAKRSEDFRKDAQNQAG